MHNAARRAVYPAGTKGDSTNVNALQDLIQSWIDAEPGRSERALARKAHLGESTVNAIMRDPYQLPRRATRQKLARALDLPLATVEEAAAAAVGFHTVHLDSESQEMHAWAALLDDLPPADRDELWEIGRMKLRRMKEERGE